MQPGTDTHGSCHSTYRRGNVGAANGQPRLFCARDQLEVILGYSITMLSTSVLGLRRRSERRCLLKWWERSRCRLHSLTSSDSRLAHVKRYTDAHLTRISGDYGLYISMQRWQDVKKSIMKCVIVVVVERRCQNDTYPWTYIERDAVSVRSKSAVWQAGWGWEFAGSREKNYVRSKPSKYMGGQRRTMFCCLH